MIRVKNNTFLLCSGRALTVTESGDWGDEMDSVEKGWIMKRKAVTKGRISGQVEMVEIGASERKLRLLDTHSNNYGTTLVLRLYLFTS